MNSALIDRLYVLNNRLIVYKSIIHNRDMLVVAMGTVEQARRDYQQAVEDLKWLQEEEMPKTQPELCRYLQELLESQKCALSQFRCRVAEIRNRLKGTIYEHLEE